MVAGATSKDCGSNNLAEGNVKFEVAEATAKLAEAIARISVTTAKFSEANTKLVS